MVLCKLQEGSVLCKLQEGEGEGEKGEKLSYKRGREGSKLRVQSSTRESEEL